MELWAGSPSVVVLSFLISSLNKTPTSECTRRASERAHGHPLALRNITLFGWVCSQFAYYCSDCTSWRCVVAVLSSDRKLYLQSCGVKSHIKLLFL